MVPFFFGCAERKHGAGILVLPLISFGVVAMNTAGAFDRPWRGLFGGRAAPFMVPPIMPHPPIMPSRLEEFRKAAAECLHLAHTASDPSTRATLLMMAQRWHDLSHARGGAAAGSFKQGHMEPEPKQQARSAEVDDRKK
jgi:hypothetical protein